MVVTTAVVIKVFICSVDGHTDDDHYSCSYGSEGRDGGDYCGSKGALQLEVGA